MAMCRYRITCRSQFHLVGTVDNNRIARFDTCQYLYALPIICTQRHFLLFIAFFIQLQIDKE